MYGLEANIPPAYLVNSIHLVFGAYYTFTYTRHADGLQEQQALQYVGWAIIVTALIGAFMVFGDDQPVPKPGAAGETISYRGLVMGNICIVFNVSLAAALSRLASSRPHLPPRFVRLVDHPLCSPACDPQ